MKIQEYNQRVKAICEALRVLSAIVHVRRRKLAHREKTYLHIVAKGGHWEWKNLVMPTIHRFFPDAYMTSGGFGSEMDITIALEK